MLDMPIEHESLTEALQDTFHRYLPHYTNVVACVSMLSCNTVYVVAKGTEEDDKPTMIGVAVCPVQENGAVEVFDIITAVRLLCCYVQRNFQQQG